MTLDFSETARYIQADILDSFDEELEMEYDDAPGWLAGRSGRGGAQRD